MTVTIDVYRWLGGSRKATIDKMPMTAALALLGDRAAARWSASGFPHDMPPEPSVLRLVIGESHAVLRWFKDERSRGYKYQSDVWSRLNV